MRPYGSSTDINVLCKNQSSPTQSAQHHRPLAPCMLAHADGYHMLTPVYASLSPPLFCMLQTRNANQARLRARLKQPGESKTRVYRGRNVLFFSLSLFLCSAPSFFEQAHPSIYLFFPLGGFCLFVPSRRHPFPSLPFDLVDSISWPASYTPLFVAEVVVILNYKRGIVHGDFSLYFPFFIFVIGSPPLQGYL